MGSTIESILQETRTVAVVGLSDNPERPSHGVARFLKDRGFHVIPVNPFLSEVLGEKAYPSLSAVPVKIDMVDVFRKSGEVPAIAEEAIRIGARFFWMQEGVVNKTARDRLERAGIRVVMDLCIKKEIVRLGGKIKREKRTTGGE